MAKNKNKIPGYFQKKLESIADSFSEQSGFVRGVVSPLCLAVANLVAVKFVNFNSLIGNEPFTWSSGLAILGFISVNGLSATVSYLNSEDLKSVRLQNDLLSEQIKRLDNAVTAKSKALCEALASDNADIPEELIVDVHKKIAFNKSITELTANLFQTLEYHLKSDGWLSRTGGCHLAFLEPNEQGVLRLVGSPSVSSNTSRTVPRITGISVNAPQTMAARLWKTKATSVMCARSTNESESRKEFLFQNDEERDVIKSIFIYRIDNPITGAPIGMFSIDANEENVFPDKDEVIRKSALEGIFRSYGERVKLEWVYSEILARTEPVFAAGIEQLNSNGD